MKRPFGLSGCCLLLAAALCLPGCASKYPAQTTKVNHYPQCYGPMNDLRRDENSTARTAAGGALIGALGGAVIGALATGKIKGALVGAAGGAAAGGLVGASYGASRQKQRDAAYLSRYAEQLGEDTSSMTRATAAAKTCMACYDREFRRATADFRAGRMNRFEFQERYEEIREGMRETSALLGVTASAMQKKDEEYRRALAEDYVQPAAHAASAQKRRTRAKASQPVQGTRANVEDASQETRRRAHEFRAARADLGRQQREAEARAAQFDEEFRILMM